MALISCPQCGGKVSDSAQKCVHCGYDFLKAKQEEEKAKEKERQATIYNNLPEYEQKRLTDEFNAKFPQELAFENKRKAFNVAVLAMNIVFWVAFIIDFVLTIFGEKILSSESSMIAFLVVLFVLLAAYVIWIPIYLILKRKLKIRGYQNIKRFGRWLKHEKGLTYNLILSEKEKPIFASVQI